MTPGVHIDTPPAPLAVAIVAPPGQDRDLVARLVCQSPRAGFSVEPIDPPAAPALILERRHDAYIVTDAQAERDLLAQAAAVGRPVIVLLAEEDAAREEALVAAGAWECLLAKSLTAPSLARCVGRAVERSRELRLLDQRERAREIECFARFAGHVAHDFNNLLTAMLGYAELLRATLEPGDPRLDDVREIQQAGERATAFTRQLLACGRRQAVRPRALDLGELVRSIEPSVRALLGSGCELVLLVGDGVPQVQADPAQIQQLITILALNAHEAMPSGGRLTIETARVDLSPAWAADHLDARPGPHGLLAVRDTGCGLTPEARAHLFEPFFTTKPKGKGPGLGLAQAYGIVRQAGAHVSASSEPGKGTSFEVYFPAM